MSQPLRPPEFFRRRHAGLIEAYRRTGSLAAAGRAVGRSKQWAGWVLKRAEVMRHPPCWRPEYRHLAPPSGAA